MSVRANETRPSDKHGRTYRCLKWCAETLRLDLHQKSQILLAWWLRSIEWKCEWLTFFKVPRKTQFSNSFLWSWTCFDVENQLSAYRRCRKWLTSGQVSRQTCPTSFLKHEHCCCLLTWTDVGQLRGRSIRFFSTIHFHFKKLKLNYTSTPQTFI